jgi:lipocalin
VHKTDYERFAIVGSPDRNSLFILARRKQMSKESYAKIVAYSKERLGYDVSRLVVDEGALVH